MVPPALGAGAGPEGRQLGDLGLGRGGSTRPSPWNPPPRNSSHFRGARLDTSIGDYKAMKTLIKYVLCKTCNEHVLKTIFTVYLAHIIMADELSIQHFMVRNGLNCDTQMLQYSIYSTYGILVRQ